MIYALDTNTLIAGTALAHNAVLVTHHVDEFTRVPGLHATDWYASRAS
ncbi:MAG: hypothetical protein PF508_12440 [Spirochaeta sp.]|nr:hypothetical protein [Spirochaeta sp.]